MDISNILPFALGVLCGSSAAAFLVMRIQARRMLDLTRENATLAERVAQHSTSDSQLENTLLGMSQKALQASSAQLAQLTKSELDAQQGWLEQTTSLVSERLREIDRSLRELEKSRLEREGALGVQLSSLNSVTQNLTAETRHLHRTLSAPRGAGRWGEVQLRNIVEATGLVHHCDFLEQPSISHGEAHGERSILRPDLVIRLPGEKCLIVDSKAPVQSLLGLTEDADEQTRASIVKQYGVALRRHIRSTSQRNYPAAIPHALPHIAIFIPSEVLLSFALEAEQDLFSYCEEYKVLLCTPLSLLAYLHTVALGWKETNLRSHAEELRNLGISLFDHVDRVVGSFDAVGRSLSSAVNQYNEASGILDKKVIPVARRFREIEGRSEQTAPGVKNITQIVQPPTGTE